jgi:hypothetical protein
VYLLELKVSSFGTANILSSYIINFLIELIKNLIRYNRVKSIDDSIFVLFSSLLFSVSLKEFYSFIDVEAEGHIDESQEIVLVVN